MAESTFLTRLREARLAKGYSQTELAKMVDIAPGQVNRYEAGKNVPRLHVIARLAGALGVHPEWLHLGWGPRESGSTTAYSQQVDVTTTPRPDGGMEIALEMDDETYATFSAWAAEEGMSVDDFLKMYLLRLGKEARAKKAEPDIEELARRVKALIQADEPKP